MLKINIVYGTVGGNTELVCEKVAEMLVSYGHEASLFRANTVKIEEVMSFDLMILASPTYGKGELEPYFAKFLNSLAKEDYEPEYHLESARIITEFLKEKNATLVHMPLRISKNPLSLWSFVENWASKISEKLTQ